MTVLERVREVEAARGSAPRADAAGLRAARERLKASLVERLGLATIAGMLQSEEVPQVRAELLVVLEAILNTQGAGTPVGEERETLLRQVMDEVCGLGPIQPLLEDDQITEVIDRKSVV